MKAVMKIPKPFALIGFLIIAPGCSEHTPSKGPKSDLKAQIKAPFAEKDGYWHGQSRIGFLYPAGWEKLGVKDHGPFTALGLRKNGMEVTLYWTKPDEPINSETIGQMEWSRLSSIYGNKIGPLDPFVHRGKAGFRIKISGGPLGEGAPELAGVVFVFALKAGHDWWKIKLRATTRDRDQLAEVEKLLDNYRW